jgi:hypothetical protein
MATMNLEEARGITDAKEKQYGLPSGTLYKLGGIESSFNKNAVSPAGAKGYFQFMDTTAKAYGLNDPTDFEQSADAAGRYMQDNLKKYNGNMDMSLADYNGGGRAVKALANGTPWKETSDYLSKFNGTKYAPMASGFTTAEPVKPALGTDATEMAQIDAKRAQEGGGIIDGITNLPSAIADVFENNNSAYNLYKTTQAHSVEQDFKWTKDLIDESMKDIPEANQEFIQQSMSHDEINKRRALVFKQQKNLEELSSYNYGFWGSLTTGLVGTLPDIPTLLMFIPAVGGTAALTTTSRIANAVRGGLIVGGSSVAYEAAIEKYKPLATTDDLYTTALMGLGVGAIFGGAFNPAKIGAQRLAAENLRLSNLAKKAAAVSEKQELKDAGFKLSKEGEEYFRRSIEQSAHNTSHVLSQEESLRRIFNFDVSKDYTMREGIVSEVRKSIDTFDRPLFPETPFGAEDKVKNLLKQVHEDWTRAGGTDTFKQGVIDSHFKFDKAEDIKTVSSRLATKEDLAMVGVKNKQDILDLFGETVQDSKLKDLKKFSDVGSSHAVLDELKLSKDPAIAELAQHLKDRLLKDVPVYNVRQHDIDKSFGGTAGRFAGFYASQRHGVFMPKTASDGTKLHEILHAATVHKIDYGLANPNSVHGKIVSDLQVLYNEVLAHARATGFAHGKTENLSGKAYYLRNMKEFTAGLYTGKGSEEFKTLLAGMKDASGGNYLSKVVDIVRRLFGFDEKETNALLKAFDITDKLLDERLNVNLDRSHWGGQIEKLHFHAPEGIDPALAEAATRAELAPIFGWGLGLEYLLGGKKASQAVRQLAAKLFGSTVGYKGHAVVKANASEDAVKLANSWVLSMQKKTTIHFNEWMDASDYKFYQKGQAFDDFGTQVSNYIRDIGDEHNPLVAKAGEEVRKILARVVDHINNPALDEGYIKKGLTEREIIDVKTGLTELVGKLEKNPNYVPRKHDVNKWNSLVATHGKEAVEGWWASAYKSARGEAVTDAQAKKFGEWYYTAVEEAHANRTSDMLTDMLKGQDLEALKLSLKRNGGFNDSEVEGIIEGMFPTKPSDNGIGNSNLRHRNTIDERYTETWTLEDGTQVKVGINDFTHSNVLQTIDPYLRRTAGSVSLAKHLDVYKTGDIDKLISDATINRIGADAVPEAQLVATRGHLQFAFDRIMGIPQEEFTAIRKIASMWHDFNVARLLGGTVFNQAVEMSQIIGSMGYKATMSAVTELETLTRDIATGRAPHDFLEHLENTIGGAGGEYVQRMDFAAHDDWVRNVGDTAFNRGLDKFSTVLKKTGQGVLDLTGMTPLMIQQKRIHAIALVNHFINHANGKIVSSHLTKDRLAWMGLSESDAKKVFENLNKYTKDTKGEYAATQKLDFEKWVREDPASHSKFMTAIHRESRRVIQENDLASMVPLMGTTLGKTVFQFMNFGIHGWNKSLMMGLNHKDYTSLSTVLHGSYIAALAYMGRTTVQSIGMDEKSRQKFLDKRMSTQSIVFNSFGKLSQVSLLPNIYDTLSPYPLFTGMRTTSDLSSMASNPTYSAINSIISTKKIVKNAISGDTQTTAKDIKNWGKLLPANNVFPISMFLNSLANDFPQSEVQK